MRRQGAGGGPFGLGGRVPLAIAEPRSWFDTAFGPLTTNGVGVAFGLLTTNGVGVAFGLLTTNGEDVAFGSLTTDGEDVAFGLLTTDGEGSASGLLAPNGVSLRGVLRFGGRRATGDPFGPSSPRPAGVSRAGDG